MRQLLPPTSTFSFFEKKTKKQTHPKKTNQQKPKHNKKPQLVYEQQLSVTQIARWNNLSSIFLR